MRWFDQSPWPSAHEHFIGIDTNHRLLNGDRGGTHGGDRGLARLEVIFAASALAAPRSLSSGTNIVNTTLNVRNI